MSFIKPLNYLNHYHREYKDKIFSEKVDFNEAYRLGYDRVGCWCCPNNNQRAQFLSKICKRSIMT